MRKKDSKDKRKKKPKKKLVTSVSVEKYEVRPCSNNGLIIQKSGIRKKTELEFIDKASTYIILNRANQLLIVDGAGSVRDTQVCSNTKESDIAWMRAVTNILRSKSMDTLYRSHRIESMNEEILFHRAKHVFRSTNATADQEWIFIHMFEEALEYIKTIGYFPVDEVESGKSVDDIKPGVRSDYLR